jgi:hypothetical protein
MELKEFIENAISDITSALNKSSQDMIEAKTGNGIPDAHEIKVSFDIAVTVNSNDTKEGGGKINVLGQSISLGGSLKNTKDVEQVSRLTFDVPVYIKTLGQSKYAYL